MAEATNSTLPCPYGWLVSFGNAERYKLYHPKKAAKILIILSKASDKTATDKVSFQANNLPTKSAMPSPLGEDFSLTAQNSKFALKIGLKCKITVRQVTQPMIASII